MLLTIEIFPKMKSKFHQLDIEKDSMEKKIDSIGQISLGNRALNKVSRIFFSLGTFM